jgi:hypothetical protein
VICNGCAGVGIDATLHGSATDPAVTWITTANGVRWDAVWPAGFRARFTPGLEVFNQDDRLVLHEGSHISGICSGGGKTNNVYLTPDASGNT